jgi:hypothetical protein
MASDSIWFGSTKEGSRMENKKWAQSQSVEGSVDFETSFIYANFLPGRLSYPLSLGTAGFTWKLEHGTSPALFHLGRRHDNPQDRPPPRLSEDVLAWAPTKNGIFTIKSAYWLAVDKPQQPSMGATSRSPDSQHAIWKAICGCLAPHTVRVFAWRLTTNGLATWDNKHKRNLEVSNICVICGVERKENF